MNEFCPCGTNTVMKASWTDHNPGRRYIECERFKQINGCNYFVWIDPRYAPELVRLSSGFFAESTDLKRIWCRIM
ncbi:hypothetical protein BUALT_Bualt01G0129700 [Buddleja alternifolia]|uniref:GRF-type domain-containing protein n=1 Tax=Buddleja alternifolia TaxID=168488 RepID=A0AAV6Y6T0_9LAMI|nr:hypothetical protein BUALT_Bualt01G0129700 [Buddleja alternifolia]